MKQSLFPHHENVLIEVEKYGYMGDIMKNRKKNQQFEHIGNLMGGALEDFKKSIDHGLLQAWDVWADAVGPVMSEHTRPAAFKGKLLLVHVTDSTWLQELQYLKTDIIRAVNEALGADLVEDMKFAIGPI